MGEGGLKTGEVIRERALPGRQLGEGLALWGDEIVSLTWRDGAIHRWDAETLDPPATRADCPLVAWGLATCLEGLVHTDGSVAIRVLDPQTYKCAIA